MRDRLVDLSRGQLNDQDRRRLDDMAREDPFVADALEGYAAHAGTEHEKNLEAITQRVTVQRRARRRWLMPNLTITTIAACMIFLLGAWFVIRWIGPAEESRLVILSTDSLANDEMTTGPATSAEMMSRAKSLAGESIPAEPIDGLNAYVDFLNRELNQPLSMDSTANSYQITIRFNIDSEGRPVVYLVEGLDPEEEFATLISDAIRNGPGWRCLGADNSCAGELQIWRRVVD